MHNIKNANKSICLDFHGIINSYPEFFSALTQSLAKDGWEITIATGSHIKDQGIDIELERCKISYNHLFSIADYHRNNKTKGMWYDKKGDPWVSDEDWDKTKADYCEKHNIAFCLDDTARYARYFTTPFGYMAIQIDNKKRNRYLEYVIDMFKERSRKTNLKILEEWFNKKFGRFFSPTTKLGKENKNKIYK